MSEGLSHKLYARIPVELDRTPIVARNRWVCKACGKKKAINITRYKFERYSICANCVMGSEINPNEIYETTLNVRVKDDTLREFYESIVEEYQGTPYFPIVNGWSFKSEDEIAVMMTGVSFKFSDNCFFEAVPAPGIGVYGLLPTITNIIEDDKVVSLEMQRHPNSEVIIINDPHSVLYRVQRHDLRPFNVSIASGENNEINIDRHESGV